MIATQDLDAARDLARQCVEELEAFPFLLAVWIHESDSRPFDESRDYFRLKCGEIGGLCNGAGLTLTRAVRDTIVLTRANAGVAFDGVRAATWHEAALELLRLAVATPLIGLQSGPPTLGDLKSREWETRAIDGMYNLDVDDRPKRFWKEKIQSGRPWRECAEIRIGIDDEWAAARAWLAAKHEAAPTDTRFAGIELTGRQEDLLRELAKLRKGDKMTRECLAESVGLDSRRAIFDDMTGLFNSGLAEGGHGSKATDFGREYIEYLDAHK